MAKEWFRFSRALFALLLLSLVMVPLAAWNLVRGGWERIESGPNTFQPIARVERVVKEEEEEKERVEMDQQEAPKTPDISDVSFGQNHVVDEFHRAEIWTRFEVEGKVPDSYACIGANTSMKESMKKFWEVPRDPQGTMPSIGEVSYRELLEAMGLPTFENVE